MGFVSNRDHTGRVPTAHRLVTLWRHTAIFRTKLQ